MKSEDLRSLSQFGQALWVDPQVSLRRTAETLEAVGLLQLGGSDQMMERAASALLARAHRDSEGVPAELLFHPFYRLLPEERLLLVALHFERWSYARLARVLAWTEEQVATRAWKLRVHLASQKRDSSRPMAVLGAVGVAPRKATCPEFQALNPWTQRFLDEEFKPRESLFLQNHLMGCEECRGALSRCRDLYYQVEKMIPEVKTDGWENLAEVYSQVRRTVEPSTVTTAQAVRTFLRRTENRFIFAAIAAFVLWKLVT